MRGPSFFRSIQTIIAGSTIAILLLAMGAVLWYYPANQREALQAGLRAKVTTVAKMLSWSLVTAVDAYVLTVDAKPIDEIILSAKQDPELIGIRVEDDKGQRLAGFQDQTLSALSTVPTQTDLQFEGDELHVVDPITKGDGGIGRLRMKYSLVAYKNKEREAKQIGYLIGISVFVLGSLLAFIVSRSITKPLTAMTTTFRRMAEGDLNQPLIRNELANEIGVLASAFNDLLQQMKDLSELAKSISQGKLDQSISIKGDLGQAVREMTHSIIEITSKFNQLSTVMDSRTSDILDTAKQQEAGASQQAANISEVTSTMGELAATARQIATSAESVTSSAELATRAVEDGRQSLTSVVSSMNSIETGNQMINNNIIQLNRLVQQIRGIIDLINEIADRSDLLALNAALEGTKAGEAGKGFLLVAGEMRRLAENVFSSTAEIKQLINEVTEATNTTVMATERGIKATQQGVSLAQEAERAFSSIIDKIKETTLAAKQISLATQQQHTGTDQVVSSMAEVSSVAQQWVEGIRQTTQSVSGLGTITTQLKTLVSKYELPKER